MMKPFLTKSLRRACSVGVLAGLIILGGVSAGRATLFTVENTNDSGPGSLRDAITQANSLTNLATDNTITIATTGVIRLETKLPSLEKNFTITGPGATNLAISGQQTNSILLIEANARVVVSGLTLADGFGASGGGALTNRGLLTFQSCIFTNNTANNEGGAIWNQGYLGLEACTFVSNRVVGLPGRSAAYTNDPPAEVGYDGLGGALFCVAGSARLTNCTFSGNEAIGGRGGNSVDRGGAGAGGGGWGGGIYFEDGSLVLVNCTLTVNRARGGKGGTVQGNLGPPGPDGYGVGGGFFSDEESANIHILNTIIAGNVTTTHTPDLRGYLVSLGGNLVQDTNGMTAILLPNDIINTSPLLGPLQANYSPIPTHAISANSPALDAGVANGAAPLDARGVIRPQGLSVDIGAYEWGNQAITFPPIPDTSYGAAPFELNASSSSALPVAFTVLSGPASLSPTNNRLLLITGAGPVTVVASQAGNGLYLPAPNVTNSFVVGLALLVVAPAGASRHYGETNPVFDGTISGVIYGDNITANFISAATPSTPAGVYGPATPYAIVPQISDPNGRLVNYTVITTSGTLTITKAAVAIYATAHNATRYYGAPNPGFTGNLSNVLNGDNITATFVSAATINTPVGVYGPATPYAIVPLLSDPDGRLVNYTVITTAGTLTITKAAMTLYVMADNASRYFGDPNPVFTGTFSSSNLLNGDNITATFDSAATTNTPPGVYGPTTPYAIVPGLSDPDGRLPNYDVVSKSGTLTIDCYIMPTVEIISPTNGSVFLIGMNPQFQGEVFDPHRIATNVYFLSGTNHWNAPLPMPATDHFLTYVTVSNLPGGAHRFTAEVVDKMGRTNVSAEVNISVVTNLPFSAGPIVTNGLEVFQTGFYWQDCWFTNPTPVTLTAVRIEVRGLTNAWLWNATGTNSGGYVPYIQDNTPLGPGEARRVRLKYYVPDGSVPVPILSAWWHLSDTPINPVGIVGSIGRIQPFANSTFLLDFTTLSNRQYYIQYSADLTTWNTSLPALTGVGGVQQWLDYGPPVTTIHPANAPRRFYRLLLVPNN